MAEKKTAKGRTTYSSETRGAVMAALLTGQSVSSVAREYSIPKGTVSAWKDRSFAVATVATVATAGDPKTPPSEVGALVMAYLVSSLHTLRAQVEVFGDREFFKEWLKNQPASEAAVLHGVLCDKTIRLLEGLAPDPEPAGGCRPADLDASAPAVAEA